MANVVGQRVSVGEGESKMYGTVMSADVTSIDIRGGYPIEVMWDDWVRTQTMSYDVDWSKEAVAEFGLASEKRPLDEQIVGALCYSRKELMDDPGFVMSAVQKDPAGKEVKQELDR